MCTFYTFSMYTSFCWNCNIPHSIINASINLYFDIKTEVNPFLTIYHFILRIRRWYLFMYYSGVVIHCKTETICRLTPDKNHLKSKGWTILHLWDMHWKFKFEYITAEWFSILESDIFVSWEWKVLKYDLKCNMTWCEPGNFDTWIMLGSTTHKL